MPEPSEFTEEEWRVVFPPDRYPPGHIEHGFASREAAEQWLAWWTGSSPSEVNAMTARYTFQRRRLTLWSTPDE